MAMVLKLLAMLLAFLNIENFADTILPIYLIEDINIVLELIIQTNKIN